MSLINWGVVCSVPKEQDLSKLEEFGKWFTSNVHKYGIRVNQLYNFTSEPEFVKRLESCPGGGDGFGHMDEMYESICKENPSVSFVLHILPHKGSPEFEKMKHLTCRLSLIGQGVLLENALSKFSGADEAAVFHNVNQYIARRFAQIVDFKHDKREVLMVIKHLVVPAKTKNGRSYHGDDLQTTVSTVLHGDKMVKMAQTQSDSKHFRASAIVCGLPENYSKYQVAAMFSRWPVASVMLTTRCCAFIDFFDPNGPYQAKAFYEEKKYKDPETGFEHRPSVCPIQSRYLRFRSNEPKETQSPLANRSTKTHQLMVNSPSNEL